ncbi:MAG: hypothetical protein LKE27_11440 [Atopobiaceae bacterium]|jgi:hypothetical protein|nr:hypothetical protein [Atopobiaceae bacterium]
MAADTQHHQTREDIELERREREQQVAADHELCERLRAGGDVSLASGKSMPLWDYVLALASRSQRDTAEGGPSPSEGDGRA